MARPRLRRLAMALLAAAPALLLPACASDADGPPRLRATGSAAADDDDEDDEDDDALAQSAPDASAPRDAGTEPTLPTPPRKPVLKSGVHPLASDALRVLGITAPQVMQTIGNASASAGTHAQDGTFQDAPYSAATDISVRGMSDDQIRAFLREMTRYGFAGWYRKPGSDGWPASEIAHFHIIYAGAKMKRSLRDQMRDFFVNKNGLRSHAVYGYMTWSDAERDRVKAVFLKFNPATG